MWRDLFPPAFERSMMRLRALREGLWITVVLSLALAACAEAPARAQPEASSVARVGSALTGAPGDYEPLLAAIGDAQFVLLGESTHGTREFYRERARITEQLVRERGALAVAIEADWPESERVNRYVRGIGSDRSAEQALSDFTRFPRWTWRNAEFASFVESLRTYNLTQPAALRVGIYGMDVQNPFGGVEGATAWLARNDAPAAARARTEYRCFAQYGRSGQRYGEATRRPGRGCERQAAAVLADLRRRPRPADPVAAEALFAAVRSAASVAAAEAYFRAQYAGAYSWNVRDRSMVDNLSDIAAHAAALSGRPGKVVVWAHNTHVGDARATEMAQRGELNIGQLLRQRSGDAAFLVGFLTHSGTVLAAPEWDSPGRVYTLRPALPDSYAGRLNAQRSGDRLFLPARDPAAAAAMAGPLLERAVGVIYQPETERQSHYFEARLARQFDAVVYLDRTGAVTPLR